MRLETDLLPARYRSPERIGRGGMGEIYRATDEALDRTVAVKLLAEPYAQDEAVRERFTREALAAARLSGRPNVVTIFDVGEWHDRPYIVMEHLGGGSLEDVLRRGPVAKGQALAGSGRRRRRSTPRTRRESSTETSSRPTCSSTATATCTSPTSGSRAPRVSIR